LRGVARSDRARAPEDEGYAIYSHVFRRLEIEQVLEALSADGIERTRAGARRILAIPAVRQLANDARLLTIATDFVGPTAVPFRATLFDKSATANWLVVWHQDTALPLRERFDDPEWGPWSVKGGVVHAHAPAWALEQVIALRVNLDDSTATNGPLRVLPGSHRHGVFSDAQVAKLASATTPVDCTASSGGVVAMRPLTVHASSKSTDNRPRRVLHIEYASTVRLASHVELSVG
jgi:ectoine hydroxylase-related dioxygenase (phytanoyl-CoA dioxygenase family)